MLRIDLRELNRGPVETDGVLGADDPLLEGLNLTLDEPVRVSGRLQATGDGEYFWRGALHTHVRVDCRRCLTEVERDVDADVSVLFSDDPEAADDPSVYALAPDAGHIDLGVAVREELALAVPSYILCREECAGLCPRCGADLNAGPCSCGARPDSE
jgi:uncharacterized protein